MFGLDPIGLALLGALLLGFLGGMTVPTYYAIERMAGFGRWGASKFPYLPPPGKDESEALEDAVNSGEDD